MSGNALQGRQLAAVRLVVVALVTAGAVAAFASEPDANPSRPLQHLQCPSDARIDTHLDYDAETVTIASPEEIADRWARGTEQEHAEAGLSLDPSSRQVAWRTDSVAGMSFADEFGNTVAVMSLFRDSKFGWRVRSIMVCGEANRAAR